MIAPLSSIDPLTDGKYHLVSRLSEGETTSFLGVVDGKVAITADTSTVWHFAYQSDRGSYRIWHDGTNNVLDSTQTPYNYAAVCQCHDANWQQWAARLQIDGTRPRDDHRRLAGFTLAPLNFPRNVLSVAGSGNGSLVNVLPAIAHGEEIHPTQLWFALPV
ncbi:hypothetical protein BOTCAL_0052g00260 [Botryotinia calthae]|uniref:Ricin B lectin domain-containing protein n=1 Tax=Botryotinia calthae TaxID=38488 RepID=A0A4Y8DD40_9HELO|nr:hypothetical protein BOTCAL_0052g00260 [Botryotinia calthae]